jgi:hypothetical protein
MKRIAAIALFAVASTFGTGLALAQDHQVRATVPFNFTVGNQVLPAGTYSILQVRDNLIEIRNQDGSTAALSAVDTRSGDQLLNSAVLVFDRYGDRYFLRQVDGGLSAVNANLPSSKSEDRARHQENLAVNQSQVTIPLSEGN